MSYKKLVILLVLVFFSAPTFAVPSWYTGTANQTYQRWDFLPTDIVGVPIPSGTGILGDNQYTYQFAPTVDDNPFGMPYTLVEVDDHYDYGVGVENGYNSAEDYFHSFEIIAGSGMYIPNLDEPNPVKNIWIEFRYDPYLGDFWVTLPDDDIYYEYDWELIGIFDDGYGWYIAQIECAIWPNPPWEELWLYFLDDGTRLDYVEVYTQCIPEPATLLLFGVGGLALRLLRDERC